MQKLIKRLRMIVLATSLRIWSLLFPGSAAQWLIKTFCTVCVGRAHRKEHGMQEPIEEISVNETLAAGLYRAKDKLENPKKALLIHGFAGRRSQFSAILPALQRVGYEVICVDPPGHGLSAGTTSHPGRFRDAVIAADAKLGPFDLAIGHSLGGIGLSLAYEKGVQIPKTILMGSPVYIEHVLKAAATIAGFGKKATMAFIEGMERTTGIPVKEADLTKYTSLANHRLLLIHDKTDPQIPVAHAQALATAIPKADYLETSGHGHNRVLFAPEAIQAITDFASN